MTDKKDKGAGKSKNWRARNTKRTSHKPVKKEPSTKTAPAAGLAARQTALELITAVLHRGHSLDEALAQTYARQADDGVQEIEPRDRGFARLLATTVLRRHGQLTAIIAKHLQKPLPDSGRHAQLILLLGAAQLLFLEGAPHAVINTAVDLSRQRRSSVRFAGLINAVLRRISDQGAASLQAQYDDSLNVPDWMLKRWSAAYGETTAHAIASASLHEPPLDITVRDRPQEWADTFGGGVLPTGSIRCRIGGRIEEMPGFADGQWWVQDAAAALPARLCGDINDQRIADICSAPGGKTAQLANAGAHVTALDISETRLLRVRENLERLRLTAAFVVGDAAEWRADLPFDAVLVDAPCSATGTIRRHPDILHIKRLDDIHKLARLQGAILENAAINLLRPGGLLVYCTCSLEPEEGEQQIEAFLSRHPGFERVPVRADEVGGLDDIITPLGDVRTLPHQLQLAAPALPGFDGFFISRLRRCDSAKS